jgi:1,2-beta-oligoglucan phosphorylase
MDHDDIMINLFLGNEMDGGLSNLHLRRIGGVVETIPMLGPGSPASFQMNERGLMAVGMWEEIVFCLRLVLAQSARAWFWHVELENRGNAEVTCDLIHTQDIALAHYSAIRLNEFYVSHYMDHTPLNHPKRGIAIASRQNQSMGGRCPCTVTGSLGRGVAYATDALPFHGLSTRADRKPPGLTSGLPGRRMQHEHSMVSIQDAPITLAPGAKTRSGFFAWFEADKQTATSADDAKLIDAALALPEADQGDWLREPIGVTPSSNLFASAPLLESQLIDDTEITRFFGEAFRHAEFSSGCLHSFFTGERSHVALKSKELQVLRPHGHILRSGGSLIPDESALTSTVWMNGVFHSMVTQGHVSINRLLSTCHSYLGLFRSNGQRVFVEVNGAWQLLDVPSAFEMAPDSCRWIYKHSGGLIEVVSSVAGSKHELRLSISVLEGPPARFLISHHIAIDGDDGSRAIPISWSNEGKGIFIHAVPDSDVGRRFPGGGFVIQPLGETRLKMVGGDEFLFLDGVSRSQPFLCMVTSPSSFAGLVIEGRLVESSSALSANFWKTIDGGLRIDPPDASPLAVAARRAAEIFPWHVHNALVHYLSPRGLEQYSGGGWGTRDVCQGPVELLLALGLFEPIRDLLGRVFQQQNADGDWPQWFMFFDRERNIRPGDSHGDIVYWPLVALAQYLSATSDATLLDEIVPYFHPDCVEVAERATVWQHVERALDLIRRRVIAGTHLAAYGHGDWNDALQPVNPDMRVRLCSAWTVTLSYQTFVSLADALIRSGKTECAGKLQNEAAKIREAFQKYLIVDDVVAGLAYFQAGGKIDFLIHPSDVITGLSYSLLPMVHGIINDIFTPKQAEEHLDLIRKHLLGPDGAHLFDLPMVYHGGPQRLFQRAESASYFGREIGNMYTHAHLRYCEALARFGDSDGFFHALRQVNPIGLGDIVPSAASRQSNCYYSSSDAAFSDRYEAFKDYGKVNSGEIALEGGWRVYSSGAGISVRLIVQCFLGLRIEGATLVVDPVIPLALDGMRAAVQLAGRSFELIYRIKEKGCGLLSIRLNGVNLDFTRERNPYRLGAARVSMADFGKPKCQAYQLVIHLG